MECFTHEQGLLEEFIGFREIEYYFPNQDHPNAINNWSFDSFTDNISSIPCTNNPFENYYLPIDQGLINRSFYDDLSPSDSFNTVHLETNQTFPCWQESYNTYSMFQDDVDGAPSGNGFQDFETGAPFKVEPVPEIPAFDMGQFRPVSTEKGNKVVKNKVNGNQSKNLMAERRRRKRLNDRLSMLRSVVPKISKMDRTSILGDTIDYMKELLQRINNLQEEMHRGSTQLSSMTIFNDVKPHEILVRNSPKFDVERRNNGETRIEMCCAAKPELLLSTVTTLEALGLEIQQCVISCFNDFAAQASCSHPDLKQRAILNSEDIKQALFRNTGYAGKCLQ